jgi:hypothetical protein
LLDYPQQLFCLGLQEWEAVAEDLDAEISLDARHDLIETHSHWCAKLVVQPGYF